MCIVLLVHNCERDCFRIATAVHSAHQCWQGILGEVFQLRLFTSTQIKVGINDQWVRGKGNTMEVLVKHYWSNGVKSKAHFVSVL